MWKKILITITTIALAIVGTSCSNDKEDDPTASYDPNEECTISISWWGGDDRHDATMQAIQNFEETYPNIHVEVDYGSWSGWKNKVSKDMEEGTCTDIIQVNYDWLSTMSYDGSGFYDLDTLDQYIDLSNFSDDILNFGRRNEVLNAIPVSITGRCLFYNTETFKQVGVGFPTTWDELLDIAPKFNKLGYYPLELDNNTGFTAWYLSIVYEQQKTGKEFISDDGEITFTVDEIADALQFYKDLQDGGVVRSISDKQSQDGTGEFKDTATWSEGRVATILEWGSSVGKYQDALQNPDDLALGGLLTSSDAKSVGWFYKPSLLYAINKDTEYPVQSAILLDYLLNDEECAKVLGTTRGIPVSSTAYDTLKENNLLTGLSAEANDLILSKDCQLISPYMENEDMQKYYNDAVEAVSLEILTPQEASQGMYANMIYTLNNIKEGVSVS